MTKDEALKLALEALGWYERETHEKAITAIREALAQPEQEPVAFYVYKPTLPRGHLGNVSDGDLPWVYDQDPSSGYSARMLVYTSPPHRKPLEGVIDVQPIGYHSLQLIFRSQTDIEKFKAAHWIKE